MLIDIRTIPILVITLDRNGEKYRHILTELVSSGSALDRNIHTVDGIRHENPVIGCALSHMIALTLHKPPFLILEDDAHPIRRECIFDIPDDSDALYLGYCSVAYRTQLSHTPKDDPLYSINPKTPNYMQVGNFNGIYRIENFLHTHAILYTSERYVRILMSHIHKTLINPHPPIDVTMAKLQSMTNVYAVEKPVFCQLDPSKYEHYEISRKPIYERVDWIWEQT